MIRNNIVTYAATLGGALLVLVGLFGFCFPNLLGLHLSVLISLVHLASGLAALYFGLKSTSLTAARTFCTAIGALYSLAGLAAFLYLGSGDALIYGALGAGFVIAALIQPLPATIHLNR